MNQTTEIATRQNGAEGTKRLDVYAGGATIDAPRVEALATISAGYRGASDGNRPGPPKRTLRNDARQIHLHDPMGRAPGLAAALEETGHRSLQIAFPLDNPAAFIQQRFTCYSAARLEVYGDEHSLTHIEQIKVGEDRQGKPIYDGKHRTFAGGTPEYARLLKTCKADTRIFFTLGEWGQTGPEVVFPDGLGFYAIRTTSRHSVRSIQQTLAYTSQFTRGRLAGLPFVLELDHREVAGPDGSKRTVPVWTITTRPPENIRLSSKTFAQIATSALAEGAALMLPAPADGTWEEYERAGPVVEEPDEQQIATLEAGGTCNAEFWQGAWFARVKGTSLDSDEARARFLWEHTDARFNSLSSYLAQASEASAAALVAAAGEHLAGERSTKAAREYDEAFADEIAEDRGRPSPSATVAAAGSSKGPHPTSPVTMTDHEEATSAPPPAADAPDEPTEPRLVDHDTGEILEDEPPPEQPQEEMVESPRHPLYQDWASLVQIAAKLDIEAPTLELPISVTKLTEWGKALRLRADNERAARGKVAGAGR